MRSAVGGPFKEKKAGGESRRMARKKKEAENAPTAEQAAAVPPPQGDGDRALAPDSLERFARVAEGVAATTKKLEKAALLGAYFRDLDDADLPRAARYFAAHSFAMNDARTTNVGTSVLRAALSEATGIPVEDLRSRYVRLGDAGDVAEEVVREVSEKDDGPPGLPSLTLAATESLVERLSATRGTKNKQALLTSVLARATALEAKYLVKLLVGDLRIGLKEGLVEDAIARAFDKPLVDVARVNMLLGDIGETAARARRGRLHGVSMRLFHPIKFMLATAAADAADVARTMPGEFYVEDKFDGIRAQAHVQEATPGQPANTGNPGGAVEGAGAEKRVAVFSRTLDEIAHRFPELHAPLRALPTDVILDGEIVPARGEEILPFAELQKRLGRKTVGDELLASTRSFSSRMICCTRAGAC